MGGITLIAPPHLAIWFQRLPPMLYIFIQNTKPNHSKAPRGLPVLSRENSIFTVNTISPSLSLRQSSNRYAIHAGRNLPDKEFRYHRIVIVTTAVYWGLNSGLLRYYYRITPPHDLPAPGRRQSLYFPFWGLQRPVFLLNSR